MSRGLTLKGVLKIDSTQWTKGIKSVRAQLNTLRSSFAAVGAAIGAGFGISGLIKQFTDLTKELSTAKATLKNVSGSYTEYGQNLRWVRDIANQYNQSQTVLIKNFAQLKAAADASGLSLEDTKKIFESIVRAGAAFSMTTQQMENSLLALIQMASKGKISAEELRRQLGQNVPGAVAIMAKAIGVSVGEMEKLMRDGKLISAEVLPKFADELRNVTQNIDVNTIQGLQNAIKNMNIDIAEAFNFEGIYKSFLKAWLKVLGVIKELPNNIWSAIFAVGGGALGLKLGKEFSKAFASVSTIHSKKFFNNEDFQKQLKESTKEFEKFQKDIENRLKGSNLTFYDMVSATKRRKGKDVWDGYLHMRDRSDVKFTEPDKNSSEYEKQVRMLKQEKAAYADVNKMVKDYNSNVRDINRAIAISEGRVSKLTGAWWKFSTAAKTALKGIGSALVSIGLTTGIMALITAMTAFIGKIIDAQREWKKVKNLVDDTKKTIDDIKTYKPQNAQVNALRDVAMDNSQSEEKRINALKELQKQGALDAKLTDKDLKALLKDYDGLYDAVEKYNKAQQSSYRVDMYQNKLNELQEQLGKAEKRRDELEKKSKAFTSGGVSVATTAGNAYVAGNPYEGPLAKATTEVKNLKKSIEVLNGEIKREVERGLISNEESPTNTFNGGGGDESDSFKAFKKAMENYEEEVRKLNRQLADGLISQSEFDEGLKKASKSAYDAVAGLEDLDSIIKILGKDAEEWYNQITNAQQRKYTDEKLQNGLQNIRANVYKEYSDNNVKKLDEPKLRKRDTFFDYKKPKSDQLRETFENYSDYIDQLNDKMDEFNDKLWKNENGKLVMDPKVFEDMKKLQEEIDHARLGAGQTYDAWKLQTVKEDLKSMKKELRDGVFSTVQELANATDNLVNGFKQMKDTLEDVDSSGIEKIMTIINVILQTLSSIFAIIDSIKETQEVLDNIKKVSTATTATGLAVQGTEMEAVAKTATKTAMQVVAAERAKAAAYEQTAIAAAAAGAMTLPPPANLAALETYTAAIKAALATAKLPAFKNGGAVGGSKGEHPVLAHAGEIILNAAQQKNLVNGFGGEVKFRIEGKDLVGTLKNYDRSRKG